MIRLCIDARMITSSGIGTCIQNLIPFLSKPPFDLTLLVDGGDFKDQKTISFRSPIYSLAEQIKFPWKIPPCDLFWSPHYNTPLLPVKSKVRAVTIHDVCHLALPISKAKKLIAKLLLTNACKRSKKIITNSVFSKSEIIKYLGCSDQDMSIIYPGVDMDEFSPLHKTDEFKNKYNLNFPFFLFVGNFKVHKNLSTLLKAFEYLNLSDFHLVLAGKYNGLRSSDSTTFEQIQKSPAKKRIHLLGELAKSELPLLYRSAKAFVFPSFYEGFGLPPLEAMASGCPVLASNAACIPEVCSDAALYFSPSSPEELAQKMDQIIKEDNLRTQLITKGFIRCREFSWNQTAESYRTLFENLCSNFEI